MLIVFLVFGYIKIEVVMMKKMFFYISMFVFISGIGAGAIYSKVTLAVPVEELMADFTNENIHVLEEYASKFELQLDIDYQYSFEVAKDVIISQSVLEGSKIFEGMDLQVVVSKGMIPLEVYEKHQVNELGKVPIMMYHGIVNIPSSQTKYIGGNVDKDGYNRTVEAFRGDLEFYYQEGYRMISLNDYIEGNIEVELGYSPIILTFDDGKEDNFKVLGEENGELVIDPTCAVGILEEFKKKYPDYGVTATFFVNEGLFQQESYNEKILKWLVEHGYDIGNHTLTHPDFTKISYARSQEEVGGIYHLLDQLLPSAYVPIIALPFGSPYRENHDNYQAILTSSYLGQTYQTKAALRVGWEAELSCFEKEFRPTFLKRIRAYDNEGKDFDIEMNFNLLKKTRYISDGDRETIVILEKDKERLKTDSRRIITY